MEYYTHTVNGRTYDSRDLKVDGYPLGVESLNHYKRICRMAYGDLRGVKFGTVDLEAEARIRALAVRS